MRAFALLILSLVAACSSEPDIRKHLGDDGALPPTVYSDDQEITIEVRGKYYKGVEFIGGIASGENVYLVIGPDAQIRTEKRSYTAVWDDPDSLKTEIEKLDERKLNSEQFTVIRERLMVYRPVELSAYGKDDHSERSMIMPADCEIALGLVTPLFITFENREQKEGVFILPPTCETEGLQIIKDDLSDIFAMLPPLEGFDKAIPAS